jgi:hypothetical protein
MLILITLGPVKNSSQDLKIETVFRGLKEDGSPKCHFGSHLVSAAT